LVAGLLMFRAGLKNLLQEAWLARGPLAWALTPVAAVYLFLLKLRRAAYRLNIFKVAVFPVPVIVVGNVVVGGAGKTPLVIALVTHFRHHGLRVGVVSRGYGRQGKETLEVKSGMSSTLIGDEPALIKAKTGVPVVVASDRSGAVRLLLQSYPLTDVVICDDGLQHYALHRDIEIAVFDDRGIGNGWVLPAGMLREPWPQRQSQGINLILHTGLAPQFQGYVSQRHIGLYATTADGHQVALSSLHHKRVTAVAAIANPEAFFDMLRKSGVVLAAAISLPDHYSFSAGLSGIGINPKDAEVVLCTEKDAIKLFSNPSAAPSNLFSVPLVFTAEPGFYVALDKLVRPMIPQNYSQVPFADGH
jgi:tetraacyldisaccharide 4'-kinase